jgi:DnaK suppressor protein
MSSEPAPVRGAGARVIVARMPDDSRARAAELEALLQERRREAEARYREALERQLSGEGAGDSEGVHGWKASREGGADVALLEMLDQTVRQIDSALSRLRSGEYGACAACGAPIPLARLRAVPFATHCVPCQTGRESSPRGGSRKA